MSYPKVNEGEWIDVTDGEILACCDCGKVHVNDFVVLDGRILRRLRIDKRATRDRRQTKETKASIKKLKGK